jgi:hypothetical protein
MIWSNAGWRYAQSAASEADGFALPEAGLSMTGAGTTGFIACFPLDFAIPDGVERKNK